MHKILKPLIKPYAYKRINNEKLIEYVKANPDHFLSETGEYFGLTLQAIFYALWLLNQDAQKLILGKHNLANCGSIEVFLT